MGFWVLQDEFKGPNVGPFSAFYWTLVTMTTLGYGDIHPISIVGQAYSLVVVLSGIVMISLFFPVILVPVIETGLRSYGMRNVKFKEHIIICGYNPFVEALIEELLAFKQKFVVIEEREDVIRGLVLDGIPCLMGDPNRNEVMLRAGIRDAKVLIVNYPSEEVTSNVLLTASEDFNGKAIALIKDFLKSRFVRLAGASEVISLTRLGGEIYG